VTDYELHPVPGTADTVPYLAVVYVDTEGRKMIAGNIPAELPDEARAIAARSLSILATPNDVAGSVMELLESRPYPSLEAYDYDDDAGTWWTVLLWLGSDEGDSYRLADSLTREQAAEELVRLGNALGVAWVLDGKQ